MPKPNSPGKSGQAPGHNKDKSGDAPTSSPSPAHNVSHVHNRPEHDRGHSKPDFRPIDFRPTGRGCLDRLLHPFRK